VIPNSKRLKNVYRYVPPLLGGRWGGRRRGGDGLIVWQKSFGRKWWSPSNPSAGSRSSCICISISIYPSSIALSPTAHLSSHHALHYSIALSGDWLNCLRISFDESLIVTSWNRLTNYAAHRRPEDRLLIDDRTQFSNLRSDDPEITVTKCQYRTWI